jgi:hypothetical protein
MNVTGAISFSGNANVMLVGGVLPQNVLWNAIGTGSSLSLTGNGSLAGTFLAPSRSASISGNGQLTGSVLAGGNGNGISLSGNGFVWKPSAFCGTGWNPQNIFF